MVACERWWWWQTQIGRLDWSRTQRSQQASWEVRVGGVARGGHRAQIEGVISDGRAMRPGKVREPPEAARHLF
ncbi:hypothetical protein BC834DRAFT_586477 [Gloeopeniophorella convolvens]|nr:hypothetical protein BC834DRAFT_586477 [Gloeopeniophorella convolvens]